MLSRLRSTLRRQPFLPDRFSVLFHPAYLTRRGLFKMVSRAAPNFEGEVLDFGCGSKPYESLFSRAQRYVGVDIETSGHDHATSRVDVFYDGKHLPFPDQSFDAVVSFEVFEHIFNLPEVLAELRRVLKPGGQLMFSIPFAWPEHEQPYDYARYTSFGIKHLIENAGFEAVVAEKTNGTVAAISQIWIAYVSDHLAPKFGVLARPFKLVTVGPMNLVAVTLAALLPKRQEYFSNMVIQARKA